MGISDALKKPAKGVSDWHIPLNENFQKLKAAAATVKSVANGIELQNPANGTPFLRYNTNTDTVETSKNLEVSGVPFNNKADLTAADGVIVKSQLPDLSITSVTTVADKTERQALNVEEGDVAIQASPQAVFIFAGGDSAVDSNWQKITIDILGAINGQQITPAQVGTSADRTTIRASSIMKNGSEVDDHTNLRNISSNDHHAKYTDSEAVSAINSELTLSVDISGDSESVDGYNVQKNGSDSNGVINFKT
jgi:hypothetical protein